MPFSLVTGAECESAGVNLPPGDVQRPSVRFQPSQHLSAGVGYAKTQHQRIHIHRPYLCIHREVKGKDVF